MGFLFGDSTLQNTADVAGAINYNPQRQLGSGSGNYMASKNDSDQTSEQTASQEKKDSLDLAASVGVGVGGGSGSGGTVDKYTGGETRTQTALSSLNNYLPYSIVGVAVLGLGALLLFRKKGRK
ncbi:MAG: hypothetical protein LBQ18_05955 [Campylobacteraceae bacterium]|jgi:hypothetical protein|nr:hypothetical protein [Campylobacteraceae bacterium]